MFEVAFFLVLGLLGVRALVFAGKTLRNLSPTSPPKFTQRNSGAFPRRVFAYLLDGVLVWAADEALRVFSLGLCRWSLHFAYPVVTVALFGKTLGKHLLGIEVQMLNEDRPTWLASVLRESPSLLTFVLFIAVLGWAADPSEEVIRESLQKAFPMNVYRFVCALGLADVLFAIFSNKGRSLHDRIAGTVVVRDHSNIFDRLRSLSRWIRTAAPRTP